MRKNKKRIIRKFNGTIILMINELREEKNLTTTYYLSHILKMFLTYEAWNVGQIHFFLSVCVYILSCECLMFFTSTTTKTSTLNCV